MPTIMTLGEAYSRLSDSPKSPSSSDGVAEVVDVDEEEVIPAPTDRREREAVSQLPLGTQESVNQLVSTKLEQPPVQQLADPLPEQMEVTDAPDHRMREEGEQDASTSRRSGGRRPVPAHNKVRSGLVNTDPSDLVTIWDGLCAYADLIDDLDGVNNYAPEAMRLSNRCQNIRSALTLLDRPFDKVIGMMRADGVIVDQIPDALPVPVTLPVLPHLRRNPKPVNRRPQNQQKKSLIDNLTEPEIEEIAYVANKKADGDIRDYVTSKDGTGRKSYPRTSDLEIIDQHRSAGSSSNFSSYRSSNNNNHRGKRPFSRFPRKDQWKRRKFNNEDDEDEDMGQGDEDAAASSKPPPFVTGSELHALHESIKNGNGKSLVHGGATTAAVKGFVNPLTKSQDSNSQKLKSEDQVTNVDDHLVLKVLNEIVVPVQNVSWDDISGLDHAKERIKELVVIPLLRPDLFRGIRAPSKGLLLFGPPGTGKSMIGKCIASQSKATFFSMSSSSLTSKWIGEGEKLVRAMFAVARQKQPSVIFIDEIDSLLCHRSDNDHESSIRLKTEFLMQFEGVGDTESDRLLVVGATNRPEALDEAARRRFSKRLMIGLPDKLARTDMLRKLMKDAACNLTEDQMSEVADLTEGYSGSDMKSLCKEAAMGPIRSAIASGLIEHIECHALRPVDISDFRSAQREVKASVAASEVTRHEEFNRQFGALHV